MKDDFINVVLMDMVPILTSEQLSELKKLYDTCIVYHRLILG